MGQALFFFVLHVGAVRVVHTSSCPRAARRPAAAAAGAGRGARAAAGGGALVELPLHERKNATLSVSPRTPCTLV